MRKKHPKFDKLDHDVLKKNIACNPQEARSPEFGFEQENWLADVEGLHSLLAAIIPYHHPHWWIMGSGCEVISYPRGSKPRFGDSQCEL